jgi:site-specific recombinase XerD
MIEAAPRLAEWITNHPLGKDPDSPIWINQSTNGKNQALKEIGLRRLVKKVAKDAHVNKRIFPYLFRHTRNTELATILRVADENVRRLDC